jgi:FkbM family methyltransferase
MLPKNTQIAGNVSPIHTIVHLGAGRCSELANYLTFQPQQILLVEADPKLAADLEKRTADLEPVTVKCAAVAGNPGPATFLRFTVSEWNSLHAPSGLLELLPGLKMVESLQVTTVSPVDLIQPLKLKAEQESLLIVDLPGEELSVLQALAQAQLLHLFGKIRLQCGVEPLYEGSAPAQQILQWLQHQGFDPETIDTSHDPDRPCWTLRRNALLLRNRELAQQVAEGQATVERLTGQLDEQGQVVAELQTANDELSRACKEKDNDHRRSHGPVKTVDANQG